MSLARRRARPPQSRLRRFVDLGLTLAQVYAGYRVIGLAEKHKGAAWADARRHTHHTASARHLYRTAVQDYGLLIKTLQFLSSRPDVVPDEYIEVLSHLQDEVPPEPFAVIKRVVERELGKRIGEIYADFDPEPVAAASLAQVHRAVLHDGTVVAVKVQYPGIERLVDIDLKNISLFLGILTHLDPTMDFRFISEEMGRMIPKELDFINEGHNAETIAANFAGVTDIVVPDIYWQYSTRRVLTMQFVDGVKITDIAAMKRLDIDPADVAKILVVAFSEMLLKHGLFHADPHPGNLLVAPGPKLLMVDFGQVKQIGPQFRFVFAQMTRALMADDDSALGQSFRDLGFRMQQDTAEGYRDLSKAYVGDITRQMKSTNAGWADPAMFQDSYRDILRILRANHLLKVPPDLLFVGRVMGLLNGLSMTLGSRTNLLVEMSRLLDQNGAVMPATSEPAAERSLLEA